MKAAQNDILSVAINNLNLKAKPSRSKDKLIEALAELKKTGYQAELVESVISIVQKFSDQQCRSMIERPRVLA
jgi:hypothetical protein